MNLLCDKSHTHCTLEGRMPGGRLRTKYLEDYQPAMASVLAVALAAERHPRLGTRPTPLRTVSQFAHIKDASSNF